MMRIRGSYCVVSTLVVLAASALPAQAELYKGVAQGLALLDFQFSGERNVLGNGVTVNAGASYSGQTYNFGVADLSLTGPLFASAGFTRRGIPGANFSLSTGSQALGYTFSVVNGGQNIVADGRVSINVNARVNALGFYSKTVEISNTGTYTTNGLVGETAGPLAFDVGPVNQSGNLYVDLLASLTQPFFAANDLQNPFAQLSSQSMKVDASMKTIHDLQAKSAAGEMLTDQELSQLINSTILATVLGGKPDTSLFDGFDLELNPPASTQGLNAVLGTPTPEPATLGAMGLLLATGLLGRRRPR